jgi:hypothetical protein
MASEWIPVSERLPEEDCLVLWYCPDRKMARCGRSSCCCRRVIMIDARRLTDAERRVIEARD